MITNIVFVTENEVSRIGRFGEREVVDRADGIINPIAKWTNTYLELGYEVTTTFIDNRGLFTLRMEKPR